MQLHIFERAGALHASQALSRASNWPDFLSSLLFIVVIILISVARSLITNKSIPSSKGCLHFSSLFESTFLLSLKAKMVALSSKACLPQGLIQTIAHDLDKSGYV